MSPRSSRPWTLALALLAVAAGGPWSSASAGGEPTPPAFSLPVRAEVDANGVSSATGGTVEVPIHLALAAVTPGPLEVPKEGEQPAAGPAVLNPYRARVLLQSLTVPGWGQATLGKTTAAAVFFTAEVAIWTTYAAFRVQEHMRRDTYERTARITAGIDLSTRDEEYRRIVGSYLSSEEYNVLVVYRDAANLYYDDPVQYQRYIDEHVLGPADAWNWPDEGALLRYRGQRKDAQRAALRSNSALAAAIINRLLSAVHAARASSQLAPSGAWRLEVEPTDDGDVTALRVGVRRQF